MISIEGGSYLLGRDDGPRDEAPAHFVALAPFQIDRTEVTNGAFAEYLNALKLSLPFDFKAGDGQLFKRLPDALAALLTEGPRGSGLYPLIALDDDQARIDVHKGRFVARDGYATHPVAETTWAGAQHYCVWRGAQLPSEAQWEAAARGKKGRLYPWGNSVPNSARVFVTMRTGATGPVGARPDGQTAQGVQDLSGSMAEWTSSLKRPYPYDQNDGREAPFEPGERVTRGGDYIYDTGVETLTSTHRDGFSNAPHRGHRHIGFRCAF